MMNLTTDDITLMETLLPASLVPALRLPTPFPAAVEDACARLTYLLKTILPFVPTLVRTTRLAHPDSKPIAGQYFNGTLLIANLSGFTTLSSQLATAGRQGSEETSALVNRLFAVLIEAIYAYGGGVVRFSGDVVTAFFDARHLGDDHALCASTAALTMQAQMTDFATMPTSKGPLALHLRVSLHSDRVFFAEVGNASHTTLLMTGRAVNRLVVAHEATAPGEIVISDETAQCLPNPHIRQKLPGLHLLSACAGEPLHLPAPSFPWQPDPPGLTTIKLLVRRIAALRAYMPYDLPRRFAYGSDEQGEFRPVTLFFANFYAFRKLLALLELSAQIEHDTAIIGQVLNSYYLQIQSLIRRYGGSVNQIDMTIFGNRLLALFGAPTTHEDDPARAIQAALELRATFDKTDQKTATLLRAWTEAHPEQRPLLQMAQSALRQRIGIASGTVFAGIVGTAQRHEYTVIGETVNLAAQILNTTRDGDILLTSHAYRPVQHLLKANPFGQIQVKGAAQPVPVFRAVHKHAPAQATAVLRRTTPLVGREEEVTRLLHLARHALAPDEAGGRVVVLTGEAGVGKSRLANEALATIRTMIPSVLVMRTACQSYEQTVPYALLTRLLHQLLLPLPTSNQELPAPTTQPREVVATLLERLDTLVPAWSRFAPLLGPLLHLPIAETDLTRALTPDQRHERLLDLILMFCFALADQQSLVLIVDDFQWIDASSRALLERLATELTGHPILLLLISRPFPGLIAPWISLSHCTILTLDNLAQADSNVLLATLLDGEPPLELRSLFERLNGTPFFQEETVRYLLESGTLQRTRNGKWISTRPSSKIFIPLQIEQLIIARLDRLDEDTRALAHVAAVIGPRFAVQLLAAVVPPGNTWEQRLQELVDTSIIEPDVEATQPTYQFKHALIRDVAYDSMLYARRRILHTQVAAAIEQVYAANLDDQRVVLAEHYRLAGLTDQAFPHFLEAARYAQAHYANDEAIKLYQQAIVTAPWHTRDNVQPDLTSAIMIYENLGDVLALMGDYTAARENYGGLLNLLQQHESATYPTQSATLQRKIGSTHEHQGRLDVALFWLEQAAQTIKTLTVQDAAKREYMRILSDTGWVYFRRNELNQAQHWLEQALYNSELHGTDDEQAQIFNRLGGVAYMRGNMKVAHYFVKQSLAASERSGDLVGQAKALNNLGIITESQALLGDSIQYGLQAMQLNERIGNRRELAFTANNIGWALYNSGEYQQARDYFNQAIKQAAEVHDTYIQMHALTNLGYVLMALEQWHDAEHTIFRSQFIAAQMHLPAVELECHTVLGEIALRQGNIEGAIAEHQQGLTLTVNPQSEEYGRFQRLAARLALAQGNLEQAIELLQANEQLFIALQNAPEAERTRTLLASMLVHMPEHSSANPPGT